MKESKMEENPETLLRVHGNICYTLANLCCHSLREALDRPWTEGENELIDSYPDSTRDYVSFKDSKGERMRELLSLRGELLGEYSSPTLLKFTDKLLALSERVPLPDVIDDILTSITELEEVDAMRLISTYVNAAGVLEQYSLHEKAEYTRDFMDTVNSLLDEKIATCKELYVQSELFFEKDRKLELASLPEVYKWLVIASTEEYIDGLVDEGLPEDAREYVPQAFLQFVDTLKPRELKKLGSSPDESEKLIDICVGLLPEAEHLEDLHGLEDTENLEETEHLEDLHGLEDMAGPEESEYIEDWEEIEYTEGKDVAEVPAGKKGSAPVVWDDRTPRHYNPSHHRARAIRRQRRRFVRKKPSNKTF